MAMHKSELAKVLDSLGVLEGALKARSRLGSPWLTVLTYHRVHDDAAAQPFDPDVIDATPAELDRQLAFVRRHFTVIGISDLLAFMKGAPLPNNPAMITFDDGYRDCYTRALPILLAHGVRGVFFVVTDHVTNRRAFWWDRIAYILNRSTCDQIEISYPLHMVLDRQAARNRTLRTALSLVKNRFGIDVDRFVEELAGAAEVKWSPELERRVANDLVMTWDEVLQLRRAGMEVHSHTRTHRVLQTVTDAELDSELAGARKDIEEHLEERVRAVAYPVGRSVASWPSIRTAVTDSGYQLGFSNASGVSDIRGKFDPLNVKRIAVERGLTDAHFRAMLALPKTFAETGRSGA